MLNFIMGWNIIIKPKWSRKWCPFIFMIITYYINKLPLIKLISSTPSRRRTRRSPSGGGMTYIGRVSKVDEELSTSLVFVEEREKGCLKLWVCNLWMMVWEWWSEKRVIGLCHRRHEQPFESSLTYHLLLHSLCLRHPFRRYHRQMISPCSYSPYRIWHMINRLLYFFFCVWHKIKDLIDSFERGLWLEI